MTPAIGSPLARDFVAPQNCTTISSAVSSPTKRARAECGEREDDGEQQREDGGGWRPPAR